MRKLGVYIGDWDTAYVHVRKNTFVWYETVRSLTANIGSDVYDLSIWSLKYGYPTRRGPDAKLKTTEPKLIENTVIPIKEVADKYYIEWEDQTWRIKQCITRYDYGYDYENIMNLYLDRIGPIEHVDWSFDGEQAMSTLKNATVKLGNGIRVNDLAMPVTIYDVTKEALKKSLEKSIMNSCYGIGGFTTNQDPFKVVKIAEKETKTMEKKKMTETDSFLKDLNGITITSTYSKLDHGCGRPYYIYYPKMDITEEMADTLLTVLLMAKRDYIHKVVFNPEKGTTTLSRPHAGYLYDGYVITVKCRDGKFDYILGYSMARTKMHLGSDDYNWFNKIKNHRKNHIEYTEKKPTKKGGKK